MNNDKSSDEKIEKWREEIKSLLRLDLQKNGWGNIGCFMDFGIEQLAYHAKEYDDSFESGYLVVSWNLK